MNLFYVSDEMLQMVANGKELNLPDEISINDIAEFSASKLIEARQRIRELEEAQRWIPVSERLPEVNKRVEIFGGFEQTTHIGYYREHAKQWDSEDGGYWHGKNFGLITHWRPLPEPPEER